MPWEAEEGIFSPPERKSKAVCDEQIVDGGEWPFTEAGVPFGLWEWIYAPATA